MSRDATPGRSPPSRRSDITAQLLLWASTAVIALALLGWALDAPILGSYVPGGVVIKLNTALALAALAASALLPLRTAWRNALAIVLAALAGAVGLATLAEHGFGVDFGIDQLLARDPQASAYAAGRMAPTSALSIVIMAFGLVMLRTKWAPRAAEACLAVALAVSAVALVGYAAGLRGLEGVPGYAEMALPSALATATLSLGGILADPRHATRRALDDPTPGGSLARRSLPVLLTLPLLVGLAVRLGRRVGLDAQLGVWVGVVAQMLALLALGVIIVRRVSRAESAAAHADEAARRLAAIVETTDDAVLSSDLDGVVLTWNAGAQRLYGYAASEIVGKPVSLLLPPGDEADIAAIDARLRRGEHVVQYDAKRRAKDGRILDVTLTVSFTRDVHGTVTGSSTIARDVTAHRRAEEDLRLANRRLAMVSAVNQRLLHATDENALLQATCDAATGPGGYRLSWVGHAVPEDEAVVPVAQSGFEEGYLQRARISWGDNPRGRGPTGRAARTRQPQVSRDIQRDPSMAPWRDEAAKRGYASSAAIPLVIDDDVYVFHAYSQRPDAFDEAELRTLSELAGDLSVGLSGIRSRKALAASEERYRLLAENAEDMVTVTGADMAFRYVSPASMKLLGYAPEEMQGRKYTDFTHPDDIAAYNAHRMARIAGSPQEPILIRWRRKDGAWIWGESVARNITNTGQPVLVVSVMRDVTRRKQAEEEVARLNRELESRVEQRTRDLEAANKELESFSYSVSHDLRAPLRAIDGFSRALLMDYKDKLDAEGRDELERVRAASQRMASLIDDILKLSRLGRVAITKERVDVTSMATAILAELRAQQPARVVETHVEPGMVASGDAALLRVVLQNYLDNAWKFTSKHATATIEVGTVRTPEGPAFFVRDDGAGFDPRYSEKLFGAFQRLHSTEEFPGNGIGLATVRRIVARHGGRTWAEGQVEKGATFYFLVPKEGT